MITFTWYSPVRHGMMVVAALFGAIWMTAPAAWAKITDCKRNGVPVELDIAAGTREYSSSTGTPDEFDLASGASLGANADGTPDRGDPEACCFPDGSCSDVTPEDCTAQGGTTQFPGSSCATVFCPPIGACCLMFTCEALDLGGCFNAGGQWQGEGTTCATTPFCPEWPRACCFPDGSCSDLNAEMCANVDGHMQSPGTSCATYSCPQPPCPDLFTAVSEKICNLPIGFSPSVTTSEPRQGGISRVRLSYDGPPTADDPLMVIESDCTCPPPAVFAPYDGPSSVTRERSGSQVILTFTPPLAGPCTYQVTVCSAFGTTETVRLRALVGDVNDDGQTDATDRSAVVGVWTGSGYTCKSDLNGDGATNATDRSMVVGAWTSGQNCAP